MELIVELLRGGVKPPVIRYFQSFSTTAKMGFNQRYDRVSETDEAKDELLKDDPHYVPQPQKSSTALTIAWWKLVLCNLIAAGLGAGAMYLIASDSFPFTSKSASHSHASAESAAVSAAASVSTSFVTTTATATTTLSAATVKPSASIERIGGSVFPSNLTSIVLDCGHSPEEARAKGCVYDVMMQDWVPEPCYDAVLTEKYLKEGNYTWYADGQGETTISDEVMALGEHGRAWMSTAYHKDHCVFSWNKIIRALRNRWPLSQELLSYDHVMHCSMGALRESSFEQGLGVSAPTNYAKCALYETWILDLIPDEHNSTQK